jgi:hypothetical protein
MSKLVTAALQHPSASVPNLVLNADGTVDGPGVGKVVDVKTAILTDVFSASVASKGSVDITGLTITHETADPANQILLWGVIGVGGPTDPNATLMSSFAKDGTFIHTHTGTLGGRLSGASTWGFSSMSLMAYDTPGSGSKVYTARAINGWNATGTIYVNRQLDDTDTFNRPRGVSLMFLMEVKP